jgi:hypothetical protein
MNFEITLDGNKDKMIKLATDYANVKKFAPGHIKEIKIIKQDKNHTITEETLVFSTRLKKEIIQQTKHSKYSSNELLSEIITGPAKGTSIKMKFQEIDNKIKVEVNCDLKLSLKAIVLKPIIKKYYKIFLTGVCYRMSMETI